MLKEYAYFTQPEVNGKIEVHPRIHCDMDGVIANFTKAFKKSFGGIDPSKERLSDYTRKQLQQFSDWWTDIPLMRDAKKLIAFIYPFDTWILSAYEPMDSYNSKRQKIEWMQKNFNFPLDRILLVRREQKQFFAVTRNKPNVLIDDFSLNIQEWVAAGGIGIKHVNAASTIKQLHTLGFH